MLSIAKTLSLFVLVYSCNFALVDQGFAQSKVEVDEEVQVLFLGEWRDGVVVERKGREARVRFTFVNEQTKVFDRNDIRRMNEVDALDFSRTWRSKAGGHEIQAALKSIEGEKVTLIKEDMSEITVDLTKLSPTDNNYVKKFNKARKRMVASGEVPMQTPDLPEIEYFGQSVAGSWSASAWAKSPEPVGKMPKYLAFTEKGFGFRMTRDRQELVAIIPVGGPDELVLVTTRDDNFANRGGKDFQSQAYWISMKKSKMVGTVALTPYHYALDYDPRTRLLITKYIKTPFEDKQTTFTVWKLGIGEEKAEPITRWSVDEGSFANAFMPGYVKLINDHIVVAKTAKHTFDAWDFVKKEPVYSLKNESFFDVPATLTPNRKKILFPEDGHLSVVDAATGEYEARLPAPGPSLTGANIDRTGTKVVACSRNSVLVWDLTKNSTTPKVYKAPNVGGAFKSRIEWVDDDHVLLEAFHNRVLYRLSLELPVWSYVMDVGNFFDHRDPRKHLMVDGKVFYFAQPDFANKEKMAIGIVDLPGPQVAQVTRDIQRDELNVMKAGVRVAIDTSGVKNSNDIRNALEKKVEDNGWIIDEDAEIVLKAEMGRGKSQNVVYEEFGGGGRQSVTFAPYYSSLTLTQGEVVLWRSGTSTGAPPIIRGNNAQRQVSRMQKPDHSFFERVTIPAEIIDPKYSRGFGVSKLGLRGIEVVSTSPPGRAADPDEEARNQQEEQEQKAAERDKERNRDRGQ